MSRLISKAEGFEAAYEAFQNVNFAAFDFHSIKESMIDYLRLYFPETFNDFIESSEFIALLELFAYVGELLAYRYDLNAHENTIDFAERKQSVLRLAKFISYKASRNVPARGLVSIDSISTSEQVFDAKGVNLSNRVINWNDSNNVDWKDQFFTVMNQVMEQDFGTVSPDERVQVENILYELYPLRNEQLTNGVIGYNTSIAGTNFSMELVSAELNEFGPKEERPANNVRFNILYGSDGLGDGSRTTGFFIYTKQGSLQKTTTVFDGILPNQTYDISTDNINETDVWVNHVDPVTGDTLDDGSEPTARSGEWSEVDIANAQNIIFNTNPNRNKYEIESLEDDQVRLIFGDGEFSDIPSGTFDIWYRTSINDDIYIPKNGVVSKTGTLSYLDINGRIQTFSITFSLISALQNNAPSEDIDHIRRTAPSVYYTQDRMVNGRDYNNFPLQDSSILKLRTVNRTFAGQSNYEQIEDPSETYQDVKMFSDDLAVYYKHTLALTTASTSLTDAALVENVVEPLLSSIDFFTKHLVDFPEDPYRREFTVAETTALTDELALLNFPIGLVYAEDTAPTPPNFFLWTMDGNSTTDDWCILIERSLDLTTYIITYRGRHMIAESASTQFFNTNLGESVLTFDSLNSNPDLMTILKANRSSDFCALLNDNIELEILGVPVVEQGLANAGLPNLTQVVVIPQDENQDGVPDSALLPELIGLAFTPIATDTAFELPFPYVVGNGDVTGAAEVGTPGTVSNVISVTISVPVTVSEYTYFNRDTTLDEFVAVEPSAENITFWIADFDETLNRRVIGTFGLNSLWLHRSPRSTLIDPSTTNIHDMFVIVRAYYTEYQRWLSDLIADEPEAPTPTTLKNSYAKLLDSKMISDTVIMHPGKFKILFGDKAIPQLTATLKVIRSTNSALTDNQLKIRMVNIIRDFFEIGSWEFGETFYFTELDAVIQQELPSEISSVVLVPLYATHQFGDLYQVFAAEDEILQVDIGVEDIEVVVSYNASNLRQ